MADSRGPAVMICSSAGSVPPVPPWLKCLPVASWIPRASPFGCITAALTHSCKVRSGARNGGPIGFASQAAAAPGTVAVGPVRGEALARS